MSTDKKKRSQVSGSSRNRKNHSKAQTLPEHPRREPGKLPIILERIVRWGLILVIGSLLIGAWTSYRQIGDEVKKLESELGVLESEKRELSDELDRFSDPEWREAHWKWLTMSHKPGEYYIEFIEPGDL